MGTAGGLYHFRDQISRVIGSDTSNFFVLNSDVCCDFPLNEMIALNQDTSAGVGFVIMGTKVSNFARVIYAVTCPNFIQKD